MQQFFKITTLLLFLGIFLIPKNFNAQPILKNSCCNSSEMKHTVKNQKKEEKPCHSEGTDSSKKDCNNCNFCSAAGFFADLRTGRSIELKMFAPNTSQKTSTYLTPQFLNFTSKIWQPPKLV